MWGEDDEGVRVKKRQSSIRRWQELAEARGGVRLGRLEKCGCCMRLYDGKYSSRMKNSL